MVVWSMADQKSKKRILGEAIMWGIVVAVAWAVIASFAVTNRDPYFAIFLVAAVTGLAFGISKYRTLQKHNKSDDFTGQD
jgi:hypothetical protein